MSEALSRQTSRKADYKEGFDFYPTPPWCVRCLADGLGLEGKIVLEPAAGAGHISRTLEEFGAKTFSADINPLDESVQKLDFLNALERTETLGMKYDWVITNPPFKLLDKFIETAFHYAPRVAMFCRIQALEGKRRGELFKKHRPAYVEIFSERVQGMAPAGFDFSKSSMAAYCWIVWADFGPNMTNRDYHPYLLWVDGSQRSKYEKAGDYDGWRLDEGS